MDGIVKLLEMAKGTLNCVTVSGRNNLDMLLGCIDALDSVIKALTKPPDGQAEPAAKQEAGAANGG